MKNIKIKTILLALAWASSFGVATAQTPSLTATFSATPLFTIENFVPGAKSEAWVNINNNSESEKSAYIEAYNVTNPDNLASQMRFRIFENEIELYDENFQTFLNAGPVSLSSIAPDSSKKYDLEITFLSTASNEFESKTLGFDLCVAFWGGEIRCTSAEVGEEQSTSGSGGGGGGGSGLSGGRHLIISNEGIGEMYLTGTPASGNAIVTWDTNIPATTQVIYGPADQTYTLDINILPGMGYPFATEEIMSKTTDHLIILNDLTPGQTYVYRVVSRASPPSVSFEGKFTVPGTLAVAAQNDLGGTGSVLGASTKTSSGISTTTATTTKNDNALNDLANVLKSDGWGTFPGYLWWLLLIILILYIIWRSRKKKQDRV